MEVKKNLPQIPMEILPQVDTHVMRVQKNFWRP